MNDQIVTGNIVERKFVVDNIEDSGFNAEEIKSSTKKNLDEDLKNVWNILNNLHKQQINNELDWVEENEKEAIKYTNSNKKRRNVQLDWFEEDIEVRRVVLPKKPFKQTNAERFAEDSGIFKMSLNEGSFSQPLDALKDVAGEPNLHWNEGNFSTNAVSEPWCIKSQDQDFENLGELSDIDNSASNASLAWLSPPHKRRVHLPFNIENLLCNKKQGTS